jgi:tRNA (cytidine/uridine-2'-O-)-methyltransferase
MTQQDRQTRRQPHPFVEPVETDVAWHSDGGPAVNIVLVEPEIPQNTGTIVRLCAATTCRLHLVEPLGFSIDDRTLKRAGLDYWQHATVQVHTSFEALQSVFPEARFWFTSKKAPITYTKAAFCAEDFLVFGKETTGLPDELLAGHAGTSLCIPMFGPVRSLNLANAVSIVVYEALRQLRGF